MISPNAPLSGMAVAPLMIMDHTDNFSCSKRPNTVPACLPAVLSLPQTAWLPALAAACLTAGLAAASLTAGLAAAEANS